LNIRDYGKFASKLKNRIGQSLPRRDFLRFKCDNTSAGYGKHCDITSRETFIFLQRNDLYFGEILSGKADGIVGGAIIHKMISQLA
jgi:hypothetical protein